MATFWRVPGVVVVWVSMYKEFIFSLGNFRPLSVSKWVLAKSGLSFREWTNPWYGSKWYVLYYLDMVILLGRLTDGGIGRLLPAESDETDDIRRPVEEGCCLIPPPLDIFRNCCCCCCCKSSFRCCWWRSWFRCCCCCICWRRRVWRTSAWYLLSSASFILAALASYSWWTSVIKNHEKFYRILCLKRRLKSNDTWKYMDHVIFTCDSPNFQWRNSLFHGNVQFSERYLPSTMKPNCTYLF